MILEYLKKHERTSILISLLMIVVAILLIAKPVAFLSLVIILFSIGIILEGLAHIFNYIFLSKEEKAFSYDIIEGIFSMIAGILMLAWKERVMAIFPILISIWIMMKGVVRIQFGFQLKNMDEKSWIGVLILGILSFGFGLVIFFHPLQTIMTLTVFSGIMLLVSEIIEVIGSIYWLYHYRKME